MHKSASAADCWPEPERGRLDFYSPEEVEALAAGLHRDRRGPTVGDDEATARSG